MSLVAAIALACVLAFDDLPADWGKLSSPANGFGVTMPKEFKRQKLDEKDRKGDPVKVTIFRGQIGETLYLVAVSQFGEEYMKQPPKKVFDNARDGSVTRSKGRLVSEKELKLGKNPGREFVVATPGDKAFLRTRVYVGNDRQYAVIMVGKSEEEIDSDDAKRFFDSFRIIAVRTPK